MMIYGGETSARPGSDAVEPARKSDQRGFDLTQFKPECQLT